MIRVVVTIGGPPGSGKSTAGRRAAKRLGLEYRSVGELFRAEGARRGMDVEAFGAFAGSHPEVDRELDRAMQALAAPGRVLEGRVQGALCRRRGTPVVDIAITADEAVRIARVAGRDGQSLEEAGRRVREREASERERYRRFYGIDLDLERPDLTVDSTRATPDEVADAIVAFVRAHPEPAVR